MTNKNYCELIYEGKVIFTHTHFNACIGQAKYFYNRQNMHGVYIIKEYYDGLPILSIVNEMTLKEGVR